MSLSVLPERVWLRPERRRELLGYSIHPPFMGYSDGMHPQRALLLGSQRGAAFFIYVISRGHHARVHSILH